ncbi:GCN5 family acetyltransferase [Prauserella marina]|uniref:Ribosomal protein S18 acetylase RimI n=1 Tax=Prauserella marina TaxID=530584 RepID=A0A222W010_9PSEU|nr:GNAT family N-acetyltransferase [Prauserella marina]ASR39273.1 GCN5 family acetyltransferase [Prauserella marina]PWV84114.1 ribosomal protein S18 acetylase RimI-like enzyme [Prauserella marina]SDC30016.1 Ribosomal protein S18 acetylase RimI [Prauserella marina]
MTERRYRLRAATSDDADQIAEIWRRGWHDGHAGRVPKQLVAARTPESFRVRAADRVADTTVAVTAGDVAGFVMVVEDEVEQVYVGADHRGSGVAAVLLGEAERLVARNGYRAAWLAVVAGNARARHFYEREGWRDEGPFGYGAATEEEIVEVPCHRYVKDLAS